MSSGGQRSHQLWPTHAAFPTSTCLRPHFDFLLCYSSSHQSFPPCPKDFMATGRGALQEKALLPLHDPAQRSGIWITPANRGFSFAQYTFQVLGRCHPGRGHSGGRAEMVFMEVPKASPVLQEGSVLEFTAVSKAQGSTLCYQFLSESHAGTEDTQGIICSPSSFLSHSQLFFHSHLSFLSFRKRWSESNYRVLQKKAHKEAYINISLHEAPLSPSTLLVACP